jgi:hypothetical protein
VYAIERLNNPFNAQIKRNGMNANANAAKNNKSVNDNVDFIVVFQRSQFDG